MIYKEKILSTDKRLGRHINHDSRSRNFAFNTTDIVIKDVEHKRFVPIFNQGNIGSCTGNAGIGAINTEPFTPQTNARYTPDENGAINLYSEATKIDTYNGTYPPTDTGSDGLSIAKALKNAGMISGYQHTFTLNDALKALQQYPVIVGIPWYQNMFYPDADGRVHPTGTVAGGHEIEGYKIDTENGRIWFHNSWGDTWGINGDFYLTWADFATLLSQRGDVTVLIPPTEPAPTSNPVLTITRGCPDNKETLGTAVFVDGDKTFTCKSLELPWLDNQTNISCIPAGIYDAIWTLMPSAGVYHYELQKVSKRTGIFIHLVNFFKDLKGCIALGMSLADINKDGELDLTSSGVAVHAFEVLANKRPITVIIK